jgi:hypothetical protein
MDAGNVAERVEWFRHLTVVSWLPSIVDMSILAQVHIAPEPSHTLRNALNNKSQDHYENM